MQMLQCPNCGKLTGFKRALGFGTFFMVILTFGLWLFVIPFYPARCINCGLRRGTAITVNFSAWYHGLSRPAQIFVLLVPLALIAIFAITNLSHDAQQESKVTPSLPASDSADQTASAPNQNSSAVHPADATDGHQLRLTPNLFGKGAVSDGRTYSIALISADQANIPPDTGLFVQGIILGQVGQDTIALEDAQERTKRLFCELSPDEFQEVSSLYHIGDQVQAYGIYQGTSDGSPLFQQCTFADATNDVVSPQHAQSPSALAQVDVSNQVSPPSVNPPASSEPSEDQGKTLAKLWVAMESQKLHPQALDPSFTQPELISMDSSDTSSTLDHATAQQNATHKGVDGTVIIGCIVAPDGTPRDLQIIKSVTSWEDEAVLSAFRAAHFKAATENGHAISWPFAYEVNLRFGDSGSASSAAIK
jgi:TonB family protein